MRSPAAQTGPRRSLREEGRAEETNPLRPPESPERLRGCPKPLAEWRSLLPETKSGQPLVDGNEMLLPASHDFEKIGAVIIRRSSIPRRVHLLCRMNCRCDAPPDRDVVRELCTSNGIVKSIDSYSGTPTHPQYQVAPPPRAGRFARKARVASVSEARHGGHPDRATRRPVIASSPARGPRARCARRTLGSHPRPPWQVDAQFL